MLSTQQRRERKIIKKGKQRIIEKSISGPTNKTSKIIEIMISVNKTFLLLGRKKHDQYYYFLFKKVVI